MEILIFFRFAMRTLSASKNQQQLQRDCPKMFHASSSDSRFLEVWMWQNFKATGRTNLVAHIRTQHGESSNSQ